MASQTRTYKKAKLLGQVYTPAHIVEKILRDSGFFQVKLEGIRILDPACGDGRFLVPIVKHIIDKADPKTISDTLIRVQGWDIDPQAIAACRKNLDTLLPAGVQISWNLHRRDALKQHRSTQRFDLIIGNPPYIRIQHLPENQRKYIQTHYNFCKTGSTDAYLAFFELASRLLAPGGTCGFITPNSYFYTETGKLLREYFKMHGNLLHITNFGTVPVFGSASTYSAITIFTRSSRANFTFEQCSGPDFTYLQRDIPVEEIASGDQWQLSIDKTAAADGVRLGDICRISVGLVTLSDAHFLFEILHEKEELVYARSKGGAMVTLEKALLKPIVKGSRLKSADDPVTEHILFPYQKSATNKHKIIPENEMRTKFPHAYAYLLKVKPDLDRRDNGKPNVTAWYALGRAQGLDSSFGQKIIFSPMNRKPNFIFYPNPDVTVYSGYFIKYDGDYQALLTHLNSEKMAEFIAVAGKDFQGGYKGYNKKVIENFILPAIPN